jgi:PAS domain S-box-containing protein
MTLSWRSPSELSLPLRLSVASASFLVYALSFTLAGPELRETIAAFTPVPVGLVAWLFGLRGGVLGFLVSLVLNGVLFLWLSPEDLPRVRGYWPRALISLAVGMAGGALTQMSERSRLQARSLEQEREILRQEIEGRRRAEEEQGRLQSALLKALREWRQTVDAIESLIVVLERDGRVCRINRSALKVLGLDFTDVIGKPVTQFAVREPWASIGRLKESGRSVALGREEVHVGEPARVWDVLWTVGDSGRTIFIAHDVTPMIELQESLRQTEAMSQVRSLVAGVAHEARNPLFAITSTMDAFQPLLARDEDSRRCLQTLREEVGRLSSLMRELLEYGKPAPPVFVRGFVDEVARRVVETYARISRTDHVRIEHHLQGSLPEASIDADRLTQVFHNLIDNALHHAPRGSTVVVRGATLRVGHQQWVEYAVEDEGSGFAPEDLSRLFEPFFSRRRGGTGLGLSIVKRIIDEHQGRVTANTLPTGGARVCFRLRAEVTA